MDFISRAFNKVCCHWGGFPDVYGMLSGLWAAAGYDFDSYMLHPSVLL
jgi:hypothetical protein